MWFVAGARYRAAHRGLFWACSHCSARRRQACARSIMPRPFGAFPAAHVADHGTDFTAQHPKIVASVEGLPVGSCALDGEVIVVDERGLSIFDALR